MQTILLFFVLATFSATALAEEFFITPNVTMVRDTVNGVLIEQNHKTLAVYGDPREVPSSPEKVLFTHSRRDIVWAGRSLIQRGAEAIVPAQEKPFFLNTHSYWQKQFTARYHDYDQQTTKIPAQSFEKATGVRGGDIVEWQGLNIQVLDTPGYTRNAVSYLVDIDGKKIACTGDLIYGDGKILDIYSIQDAFDSPKTGGYHGFMGRVSPLIASLRAIAAASPDLLIPARGPIIEHPQEAILKLIDRLQAVYKNYLSISALRWYWKDEYIQGCANRVLGTSDIAWMPMAETVHPYPPEWVHCTGTSRLLISENDHGFLIDCGSPSAIQDVQKLQREKLIKHIDGIYITHYHDDHTNQMQEGADTFNCPLYFHSQYADILLHPDRYRMPAQTDRPALNYKIMNEGDTLRWNEFTLTFSFFPGQALYHGGLLVQKDNGETIFFIGDSFTPTGIDDYCTLNRNFLQPGMGFLYCLDILQQMKPDYTLINEHVTEPFRFSAEELDFMVKTLHERIALLSELLPWDNVNYGLDEQWARFYPYGIETVAGQQNPMNIVLLNHSDQEQTFTVQVKAPREWHIQQDTQTVTIPPHSEGALPFTVTPPSDAKGVSVLTADVAFGDWVLREWTEGLVKIKQ